MKKLGKLNKIFFFMLAFYVCFILSKQQVAIKNIRAQIDERNLEIEKLEDKNNKLKDEVEMTKSDSYIEKLAREKLNLIKPGESAVINSTSK
ncbi:septum formation initiator family protein [uncultured Clostridium sp.]|uniref:FtsB family cell division protein n=1 Tax=uncultured Clostridium sp. TaxID=59620 RepID=UPI0028EAB38C|nr:septum formation initiator family protein [uncultured Clostridium sp.]